MSKHASRHEKNTGLFNKHVNLRLREGIFLLSFALAAFLLFSLFSYHEMDPGWSTVSSAQQVANAGGKVGAWLSDFLLYMFGYLAYFFPVMIVYATWFFFRESREHVELDYYLLGIKMLGFLLIVMGGTGLASLYLMAFHYGIPFEAGGIVGSLLSTLLIQQFNRIGTTVFLLATLLAGITWFTGISWMKLGRYSGEKSILFLSKVLLYSKKLFNLKQWYRCCCACCRAMMPTRKTVIEVMPNDIQSKKIPKPPLKKEQDISDLFPSSSPVLPMPVPAKEQAKVKRKMLVKGLPAITLLDPVMQMDDRVVNKAELEARSLIVEQKLADFGIKANVVAVYPGPVITRYELDLAPGIKVSRLTGLAKDLARSLSMVSVRVVEIIPGKSVVGLELPNEKRLLVSLREIIESKRYRETHTPLALALGKDIAGFSVVVDLAKMPHLLVAGTTGSGKSVGINAMLLSLLYKATPEQVRLILIDPKMLELSIYDGIPHLLAPVVTDMKEASNALRWCVAEMEKRYRLMAFLGVRNLQGYNEKVEKAQKKGEPIEDPFMADTEEKHYLDPFPYIVVIIDEFADMMMVVGKKVEQLIARIAQKARAAGIHLILATQRPSVDVITGLIKANIPTRIAFQVSSRIDSRTIIDQQGAEQMLGHGDMLYLAPGGGVPIRVHGAFVADHEVHNVVSSLKAMGEPDYVIGRFDEETETDVPIPGFDNGSDKNGEQDALYDEAVAFVLKTRRASISSVQRRFKIGYNRAARIIEDMETAGVVSPMENNGTREVLAQALPEN